MKVYTYHQPLPNSRYGHDSENELIQLWSESWSKRGWDPVVLDERTAYNNIHFPAWSKIFQDMPRIDREIQWQLSCLYRWIALEEVGGGLMVDYDVINYSFSPEAILGLDLNDMFIFADTPPGIFMGTVFGNRFRYRDMIEIFLKQKTDTSMRVGDLNLILRVYKNLDWLHIVSGCANYEWPTWETAPLVHYHSGHRLTKPNQTQWIKKLRKI